MYFVFTDPEYESMFSETLGCVITDDFEAEFARVVDLANHNNAAVYVLFHGRIHMGNSDNMSAQDLPPNLFFIWG